MDTLPNFAAQQGWDREYPTFSDFDLPTYVGLPTFMNLPWVPDPDELRRRGIEIAIVGAPFDDGVSHRPGARFGPRAIREAQYTSGSIHSLALGNEPFESVAVADAGDANIVPAWLERGHAMIYRKVRAVAGSGAIPIVFGGDHSITWPAATAVALETVQRLNAICRSAERPSRTTPSLCDGVEEAHSAISWLLPARTASQTST
ncbi:MAG: arginase family protein [Chloroflexi bacterium]|nr:arginase family protein [Chloroflexota bacterium]